MVTRRLRRSNCYGPGLRRRRAGRGFYYLDAAGRRVEDPEVLGRIRALSLPPAWQDVWICPLPNGHIQATGIDARGRRQYRYHDLWRQQRDREKFDHMIDFAEALPGLRQRCATDLQETGLGRERVLAGAIRLLDLGFFRIGTEGYAEENQTYGLASMEKRHVSIYGDRICFDYIAKAGKRRLQTVVDPELAELVRALKRRRGGDQHLLAARQASRWCPVTSADINAHIRALTGGDFSAKDFRTWNATVLAAVALAVSASVSTPAGRKRAVARAMKETAHYLGNTPAVCRASYVDPRVVDRFLDGETIAAALDRLGEGACFGHLATQGAMEAAVIDLIDPGRAGLDTAAA
jgi:DNA topoisomerase-1